MEEELIGGYNLLKRVIEKWDYNNWLVGESKSSEREKNKGRVSHFYEFGAGNLGGNEN